MNKTREAWLQKAMEDFNKTIFKEAKIPKVRVSVGFPVGSKKKVIGQYFKAIACEDAVPQIFISPVLHTPLEALEVLVHECVHAVHPNVGHKGAFKHLALKVGLTGKMTATTSTPSLVFYLKGLAKKLKEYPHAKINLSDQKKQGTRLIKCECMGCGYITRTSNKWIEEVGAPLCPCNNSEMSVA